MSNNLSNSNTIMAGIKEVGHKVSWARRCV